MRQRQLALAHGIVGLAAGDEPPDRRFDRKPVTIAGAQLIEVGRIDQQRAIGIVTTPRRVAEDLIGIEHAPLPGSQHQGKFLRRAGAFGVEMCEPFEHAGHGEANFAVGMTDQRPDLIIFVLGDGGALPGRDDGVEKRIAERLVRHVVRRTDRPPHRLRRAFGAEQRRVPQWRSRGGPIGKGLPERMIEHQWGHRGGGRVFGHEGAKRSGELRPRTPRRFPQRRECIVAGQKTQRPSEPGIDFGFGQRTLQRRQDAGADMKIIGREFEVEQREFGLLVLGRSRQHVMRELRRLGHGDIDHHAKLERSQRAFDGLRIRCGVGGVGAVDPDAAQAVGMVAEHRVGKNVGRQQAGDDLIARRRESLARRIAP